MNDETNKIVELFEAKLTAAKEANTTPDKNTLIMALVTEGGLDVTTAVREYQKLAKNAGLILGAKERTKEVEELLEGHDLTSADVRRDLIIEIAESFDVSEATAAAHIRSYAEEHNIELPVQRRTSLEDMVQFVKERLEVYADDKEARAKVVQDLQNEMGYTANSAASAYSRATRELGLATGRTTTTVPLSELVSLMRENKLLGRKQMVEKLVKNLGYAESTAGSFYTYMNFAQEWAKQELADQTS